jgi:hypothetical protein
MSKSVNFITLTDVKGKRIFVKRTAILMIKPYRNGSMINVNGESVEVLEDKVTVLEMINGGNE